MKIKWNQVTWYSKLIAVILFMGVLALGVHIGRQIQFIKDNPAQPVLANTQTSTDTVKLLEELSKITQKRGATVNDVNNFLFSKYGPCWGIPENQCRE